MSCIVTNFSVNNDINKKIKKAIINATPNVKFQISLAAAYNQGKFAEWYKETYKDQADKTFESIFAKLNGNTINSIVRNYLLATHPAVSHTAAKNQDSNKGFFKTVTAKNIALEYAGYLLHVNYDNYSKLSKEQQDNTNVRDYLYKKLNLELIKNLFKQADIYFTDNPNEKYNTLKKSYDDFININNDKITELKLLAIVENNNGNISGLTYYPNMTYDDAIKKYNEEKIQFNMTKQNLKNLIIDEFRSSVENEKYYNYAALYLEINNYISSNETTEFIKELDNHKSIFDISRELQISSENDLMTDDIDEPQYDTLDILTEEDKDMIAADYDNYVYRTYLNSFSPSIRNYIRKLLKIDVPYRLYKENASYDTNNELGVALPVNERKVITQIVNFANFYSLSDFKNTLKDLANKNPDLYSIAPLIDDMEKDDIFARKVFVNFSRPLVNKSIVAITRDGSSKFIQSNEEADATSKMFFNLLNAIKYTYNLLYSDADYFEKTNTDAHRIQYAKDMLIKYFPNLTRKNIDDIIDGEKENIKDIVSVIKNILEGIQNVIHEDNIANREYAENMKKYNNSISAQKLWAEAGAIGKRPEISEMPEYNASRPAFDSLTPFLVKLAKYCIPYVSINTELNSITPVGTKSSNLIKTSYITNFFKQINAIINDDGKQIQGIEHLKNYLTKSEALANNPLLFGIKNNEGEYIHEGIFIRDNETITVNPNAKNLINFSLFEGIANRSELTGVEYKNMAQQDYIISTILEYASSIDYNHHIANKGFVHGLCNIPMRIPSDASNTFSIQVQRHDVDDLMITRVDPQNHDKKTELVNTNSSIFLALKEHVIGELNTFARALTAVTTYDSSTGEFKIKEDTSGLFDNYHIKNGKIIDENGILVGNAFKFFKLFNIDDYSASNELTSLLYGGGAIFNTDGTVNFDKINNFLTPSHLKEKIEVNTVNLNNDAIDEIIKKWIFKYNDYIRNMFDTEYKFIFNKSDNINKNIAFEAIYNFTLAYMAFDDIFEGNSKYYTDAQTFLKRAKEVQMSGTDIFAYDFALPMNEGIQTLQDINGNDCVVYYNKNKEKKKITINGDYLKLENGFNGVTIYNTKKGFNSAQKIYNDIYDNAFKTFVNNKLNSDIIPTMCNKIAIPLAKGFGSFITKDGTKIVGSETKINDAQSYITIYEFIRRRYANGTLDEYADLIDQLLDDNVSISDIDLDKLNKFIQVEKNVYFDIQYDSYTKEYYPRQIKNAEFVLIPKLLPEDSDLRKLFDIMIKNNIQQINTLETSKAANKNVIEFWDKSDENILHTEEFEKAISKEKGSVVETYYYRNLHKQQDMVDHMENKTNKAGIQIMKKIGDNPTPLTQKYVDNIQDAFTANIIADYKKLLFAFGWKEDESGNIVNINDNSPILNFSDFYTRAREEAQRLGMDSNFIEYLTPNTEGIVDLPNYFGTVSKKIESIAQSMFHNKIARQTLPGWHAVQVTSVGYNNNLQYHPDLYIDKNNYSNRISVEEYNKLEVKEQERYFKAEIVQCELPVWDSKLTDLIKHKQITENISKKEAEQSVIRELNEKCLSLQVGYRIPTEGKQSVTIFEIVGFVDRSLGSTIITPSEWVCQTGSDYDYDTVYGIFQHFEVDDDYNIRQIKPNYGTKIDNIKQRYYAYINEHINERKVKEKDYIKLAKEEKNILNDNINKLREYNKILSDYIKSLNKKTNKDEIKETKLIIKENKDKIVNSKQEEMSKIAVKAGLLSFEEFSKLPIIQQQTKRVRDNIIVTNMISIMTSPDAIEEVYSRSKYDNITEAKNYLENLNGINNKSYSTYNPFDQYKFMQNAIDGRKLKAFSVNRDTFNSINNRVKTYLNGDHAITVVYDLNAKDANGQLLYNKDLILNSYKDAIYDETSNTITITHRQLSWSNDNRNVVGELITVYSSETTAHILDAIKQGSLINETDYTFGVFKTLIDVGVDYYTAISFLMQPAISTLNFHYESANSIYKKEYNNPIKFALLDIVKQFNPSIKDDISLQEIFEAIKDNEKLNDRFKTIFNVELNKENILHTNLILNKEILERRLNASINLEDIDKTSIDLYTIILFNKFKLTTNNIEKLSRCVNPDSYGTKQTIYDTRKIINNVLAYKNYGSFVGKTLTVDAYDKQYSMFKSATPKLNEEDFQNFKKYIGEDWNIYFTEDGELKDLTEEQEIDYMILVDEYSNTLGFSTNNGYTTLLQAIYPGFDDKNAIIDIEKSRYKYIAAIFQYCTKASVQINQQIFDFETDEINDFILSIEHTYGRTFNAIERTAFKNFMLSSIYRNVTTLISPIALNKYGQVYINDSLSDTNIWDTEENRIFGYNEEISDVNIKDINHPNKEELDNYLKLTPLQKVMFIKRNFNNEDNIFTHINVSKFNKYELDSRGYSKNRLTVNTDNIDSEELFIEFNEAFFNSNPLIKLAAIDLIKYSFLVEGFNFGRHTISRIITNKALRADENAGGLGIITKVKDLINNIKQNEISKNFIEDVSRNFIRSHSFIVPSRRFLKDTEINTKFYKLINKKELDFISLNVDENTKEIIEHLRLNDNDNLKYIKISYYTPGKYAKYHENLYEIHKIYNDNNDLSIINFIPLNYLDPTENREYSLNNDNNEHYSYAGYISLLDELLKNRNATIDKNKYTVPIYRFKRNRKYSENELINKINDTTKSPIYKQLLLNFINKIDKHFTNGDTNIYPLVIDSTSPDIKSLFMDNEMITSQNITLSNGVTKRFLISKTGKPIKYMYAYHKQNDSVKNIKIPQYIIDQYYDIDWNNYSRKHTNLYAIIPIVENNNIKIDKSQKDTAEIEELASRISYSSIVPSTGGKFSPYANVANLIAKDIEYKAHHNDKAANLILQEFINKGISTKLLIDISNRANDIYYISSEYYKLVSDRLIDNLNEFEIEGVAYSLNPNKKTNDKSLYDALIEHPEYRDKFFRMILEAKTFGDTIKDLLKLPVEGKDSLTDIAINSIKKSIERVKNNENLNYAFDSIFNYYLAKEYAENPNVRHNYVKLTDIYNDVDWFDKQFSDVSELNHKQIQVVVKIANEILAKSHFDGLDKVERFKKELGDVSDDEWNHIITQQGTFVEELDKHRFFEDKRKVEEDVRDAMQQYGYNSLEYLKAKLVRDKWYFKHMEQELVDEYYEQDIANREKILKNAPDDYVRYLQLKDKIYSSAIPYSMMNDEQKEERNKIWEEINALRKKNTKDDNISDPHIDLKALFEEPVNYLNEFIENNKILHDKYYHIAANSDFIEMLERNLNFIDKYDAKHPDTSLNQKLNDSEDYKLAYDWIKENTIRTLNPIVANKVKQAFTNIQSKDPKDKEVIRALINKVPREERYDAYGIIDGTKYTKEQQQQIRDAELKRFHPYGELDENGMLIHNTLNEFSDNKGSDGGLIKDTGVDLQNIVFKSEFYQDVFNNGNELSDEQINERNKIYAKINAIVIYGFDETGFSIKRLYNYYKEKNNLEKLSELAKLYQDLREFNSQAYEGFKPNPNSPIQLYRNYVAYYRNFKELSKIPKEYADILLDIIRDKTKDGEYITDGGKYMANRFLFGYYTLKKKNNKFDEELADKYIDKKKTKAKEFISEYISFEETQHLRDAIKEAERNDTLEEFLNNNRIYNPYTKKFEWTSIWTTMTVSPKVTEGKLYKFDPKDRYARREVNNGINFGEAPDTVENAINKKYKIGEINWRDTDEDYKNENYGKLTTREKEIVNYLTKIVNNYATNYHNKKFAMEGYIPRLPDTAPDKKWFVKETAALLGFSTRSYKDREWHDIIDFTHDFDARFTLFDFIKGKGSKELIKIKPKIFETDEQYNAYLKEVNKQNEEIKKENLRIDNELLNRNYQSVFEQLIYNGEEYNARQKCKDLIYLTIEDLKSRPATKVNRFGKVSKNKRLSTVDEEVHNTVNQDNALSVFENWARRILFEEYKNISPLNRFADFLQNITTTKFMAFNLYGGVANVGAGIVNTLGEGFANDNFSAREFNNGSAIYLSKSLKMISSYFDAENVQDKYVALTKLFDVIDFDQILHLAKEHSSVEAFKKVNDIMYSFLAGGEHYMQNSVLFAMLESHRLYKDDKGNVKYTTLANYKQDLDLKSFEDTLKNTYPELIDAYKLFVISALSDENNKKKYDKFQSNPISDFIRQLEDKTLRTKLLNDYNKTRKEYAKVAEEEFKQLPTMMSQFDFVNGKLEFVKDSKTGETLLSNELLAKFKHKVQLANNKIHGVYNKIGGARIEQYWWGNLVMQYHKHLYPGIMKRFRINGMFNEGREAIDFGSYVSAFKLALNTAKDIVADSKISNNPEMTSLEEDNEIDALKSIGAFMTNIIHLNNYLNFEWNLLPTWEKQNVYRCLGDACGIASGLLTSFVIYLSVDDDDLKEDKWINSALYLADRLITESNMYTPMGLYSEGATLWSSPIAAGSTIKDLMKAVELISKYLIDPSFEVTYTNGMYKGKNKFKVILDRNIPIYRIYKRYDNIAKNNNYYRINESTVNKRLMKTIAEEITEGD